MTSNKEPSPTGYLVAVTLTRTSNPIITRLLGVPSDLTFSELNIVIQAAFGWSDATEPCTSWIFRHCLKKACEIADIDSQKASAVVYWTAANKGHNIHPPELDALTPISHYFLNPPTTTTKSNKDMSEFWSYEYSISRYHHAMVVKPSPPQSVNHTIRCLGGQGHTTYHAWQLGDLSGAAGVKAQIKGTWELDMSAVQARLANVQSTYKARTGDELMVIGTRPVKRNKEGEEVEAGAKKRKKGRTEADLGGPKRQKGCEIKNTKEK